MKIHSLIGVTFLIIVSGCVAPPQIQLTPEQVAARQKQINDQNRALSELLVRASTKGELLTDQEWANLLGNMVERGLSKPDWLYAAIGRPDETINGTGSQVYLIYNNKCINSITGKPDDLCFRLWTFYGRSDATLDGFLYDARKVRNL